MNLRTVVRHGAQQHVLTQQLQHHALTAVKWLKFLPANKTATRALQLQLRHKSLQHLQAGIARPHHRRKLAPSYPFRSRALRVQAAAFGSRCCSPPSRASCSRCSPPLVSSARLIQILRQLQHRRRPHRRRPMLQRPRCLRLRSSPRRRSCRACRCAAAQSPKPEPRHAGTPDRRTAVPPD